MSHKDAAQWRKVMEDECKGLARQAMGCARVEATGDVMDALIVKWWWILTDVRWRRTMKNLA